MAKYDGLAEELVLLQDRLKNLNNDYYVIKAHSPTNPDWDLIAFERQTGTQFYNKFLYQVKEIDWTKNKTVCADFLNLTVDFLFIVIFNSNNGIDKEQPIIFKFPKNIFSQKSNVRSSLLNNNNQLTYSQSQTKQYLSLNTIFTPAVFQHIKQYAFYNIK